MEEAVRLSALPQVKLFMWCYCAVSTQEPALAGPYQLALQLVLLTLDKAFVGGH